MDEHDDGPAGRAHQHGLSRRGFLGGVGVAAGASLVPVAGLRPAAAAQDVSLTGARPLRTAMHVHASWSEGPASWAMQFDRADEAGIDLMFMTDHDFRALADNYMDSLADARHVSSSTGAARQRAATASGGTWHLLAESSGSAPASTSLAVDPQQTAVNHLRTSIAGHTLAHTFGPSTLGPGAAYEVAVTLSLHPADGTRPAGQLELRYHFEDRPGSGHQLTERGLVGVVSAPLPRAGGTVRMPLADDVATLWPDVLAADNAFYGLSFTVTSPRSGSVADVQIRGAHRHQDAERRGVHRAQPAAGDPGVRATAPRADGPAERRGEQAAAAPQCVPAAAVHAAPGAVHPQDLGQRVRPAGAGRTRRWRAGLAEPPLRRERRPRAGPCGGGRPAP